MKLTANPFRSVGTGIIGILSITLLIVGIVTAVKHPTTITKPIDIDYKNQTFSGTYPTLTLILGIGLLLLTCLESEKNPLESILKKTNQDLLNAIENIEGRTGELRIVFGPDDLVSEFRSLLASQKLKGYYSIRKTGRILDGLSGNLLLFENTESKKIMADIPNVPIENEISIEIILEAGSRLWRTSKSIRNRIADMKEQG